MLEFFALLNNQLINSLISLQSKNYIINRHLNVLKLIILDFNIFFNFLLVDYSIFFN